MNYRLDHPLETQKSFVTDINGNSLVDFIGRFETLEVDFAKVCSKLKISATLPCLNRSRHADYRSCYNDKTIDLLAQCSREDIKYFGYNFDSNRSHLQLLAQT